MISSVLPENAIGEQLFQINRHDLGPLLIDRMGLSPSLLSPLAEVLGKYTAGSGHLSADGAKLIENELFKKLAPVLAAPDLLIKNRLGGSMITFEEIRACAGKSLGEAIAVAAIDEEDAYIVRVCNDYREYVSWWADSFAAKNDEVVANYIPPKVSLDSFLFILHAVDWFKRESYLNALNYAAGEEIYVNPDQFSKGLPASIQSKDLRWLVPSFIMLVPGIERYNYNIDPDEIGVLASMQFFNMAKRPGTGEDVFTFGEAGHTMGIEFMRSWLLSAGFELSCVEQGGVKFIDHYFVAPTVLANHFISFEMTADNRCLVNHQAYTLQYLFHKLESIFSRAVTEYVGRESEPVEGSAETAVSTPLDTPVPPPAGVASSPSESNPLPPSPDSPAPPSPVSSVPPAIEGPAFPTVGDSTPPVADIPVSPPVSRPVPPPVSKPVPPSVPPPTQTEPAHRAPAGDWYLSRGGNQYGPYTFEQLVQYARQGNVQPEDQVWNQSISGWTRAGSVRGLF